MIDFELSLMLPEEIDRERGQTSGKKRLFLATTKSRSLIKHIDRLGFLSCFFKSFEEMI